MRSVLAVLCMLAGGGALRWTADPALIVPADRDGEHFYSVKDPSIVRFGDRWHLFCTVRGTRRTHQIEYLSFRDWDSAAQPQRTVLRISSGYFCAPQVFYFRPHKKWYLIYQVVDGARRPELQPAFSTNDDIAAPDSWTPPKLLFSADPRGVNAWIDFWVICDDRRAHLFFTSPDGRMWRAETPLGRFPYGWTQPKVALRDDIYEASHTYRLQGSNGFLTIIEAQGSGGRRYYRAYRADRLDGAWTPLEKNSGVFAAPENVRFAASQWTDSFSHGELIRDGYDETLTVDASKWMLLFQGVLDRDRRGKPYGEIPWRLGLLRASVRP